MIYGQITYFFLNGFVRCIFNKCKFTREIEATIPIIKSFYKYIFSFFTRIYTVSESMKTKLTNIIDDDKINVIGDTRIDQIEYRYDNKKIKLPLFENSKNILFGSIDEYDIKVIFEYLKIRKNNSKLIFVPHEPDEKLILNIEKN